MSTWRLPAGPTLQHNDGLGYSDPQDPRTISPLGTDRQKSYHQHVSAQEPTPSLGARFATRSFCILLVVRSCGSYALPSHRLSACQRYRAHLNQFNAEPDHLYQQRLVGSTPHLSALNDVGLTQFGGRLSPLTIVRAHCRSLPFLVRSSSLPRPYCTVVGEVETVC
jgi:hypothetical protein